MNRNDRYAKYFGDIVPKERRDAIANGDPIGMTVEQYENLAIEKPHKRKTEPEFIGKPLGVRATRRLLRELREQYKFEL